MAGSRDYTTTSDQLIAGNVGADVTGLTSDRDTLWAIWLKLDSVPSGSQDPALVWRIYSLNYATHYFTLQAVDTNAAAGKFKLEGLTGNNVSFRSGKDFSTGTWYLVGVWYDDANDKLRFWWADEDGGTAADEDGSYDSGPTAYTPSWPASNANWVLGGSSAASNYRIDGHVRNFRVVKKSTSGSWTTANVDSFFEEEREGLSGHTQLSNVTRVAAWSLDRGKAWSDNYWSQSAGSWRWVENDERDGDTGTTYAGWSCLSAREPDYDSGDDPDFASGGVTGTGTVSSTGTLSGSGTATENIVTVDTPTDWQFFPPDTPVRDGGTSGTVRASGTYAGPDAPTKIEYKWGTAGSWADLDTSPSGGTWSGTFSKSIGTADEVQFRAVYSGPTYSGVRTSVNVSVCPIFAVFGQSNAVGQGTGSYTDYKTIYTSGVHKAHLLLDDAGGQDDSTASSSAVHVFGELADPTHPNTNRHTNDQAAYPTSTSLRSPWPGVAGWVLKKKNMPCAFVNVSKNGQLLHQLSKDTNNENWSTDTTSSDFEPGGDYDTVWEELCHRAEQIEGITNGTVNRATSPNSDLDNTFEAIFFLQGENDAGGAYITNRSDNYYYNGRYGNDGFGDVLEQFREDFDVTPVIVSTIAQTSTVGDNGTDVVRYGLRYAGDQSVNTNYRRGPDTYQFDTIGHGWHVYESADMDAYERLLYLSLAEHVWGDSAERLYVTWVEREDDTHLWVRFNRDLVDPGGNYGDVIRVVEDGSTLTHSTDYTIYRHASQSDVAVIEATAGHGDWSFDVAVDVAYGRRVNSSNGTVNTHPKVNVTVDGSTTVDIPAELTFAKAATVVGTATISSTAALSGTGEVGSPVISGTGTVTASGTSAPARTGSGAVASTASVSAAGGANTSGTASISILCGCPDTVGQKEGQGTAATSGTGTFAGTGADLDDKTGTGTVASTATLTATGAKLASDTASTSGTVAVLAVAGGRDGTGTAALSATVTVPDASGLPNAGVVGTANIQIVAFNDTPNSPWPSVTQFPGDTMFPGDSAALGTKDASTATGIITAGGAVTSGVNSSAHNGTAAFASTSVVVGIGGEDGKTAVGTATMTVVSSVSLSGQMEHAATISIDGAVVLVAVGLHKVLLPSRTRTRIVQSGTCANPAEELMTVP